MFFRVLGRLEVLVGGARVVVPGARRQRVLAALLAAPNTAVPLSRLVDVVWDEAPPTSAVKQVRNCVSAVRACLGDTGQRLIVTEEPGYRLRVDADRVDSLRFAEAVAAARRHAANGELEPAVLAVRAALRLWRGPALDGLGAAALTGWAARWDEQRLTAVELCAGWRLDLGEHHEVAEDLGDLAHEHPLREGLHAQLMTALARCGRRVDALAVYQRLRTRLAEELGVDPGADVRRRHALVLRDEPGPPRAAPSAVPRQLPAAPRHFVGRDDELRDLGPVEPGTVTVIAGAGGIGKTWLALHWAHRSADRFPDGQLFVDLRGFSPDAAPMATTVALWGFLAALGVDAAALPATRQARSALLRSLLADRRSLVVLDNAGPDTDQLTPLLPGGTSCAVVVTSRHHLPGLVAGHGARHLVVAALPARDAAVLLTRRLGAAAGSRAVAELVSLCGGHPLALGIVVSLARTRPHADPAVLVAELRELGLSALDGDDAVASLPTVMSWSRRALTPDQDRLFLLLALAPGAATGPRAAASLAGLPPARTSVLLRGLVQASLLTQDADGRYGMHELVRAYAAGVGPPDDDAVRRLLDHYLHTAHHADRLLDDGHHTSVRLAPPAPGTHPEPLPDARSALAWFDREHPTLLAAQRLAARRGAHDTAWAFAPAVTRYLHRRGHRAEKAALWRVAAEAADHLTDHAKLLALRHLGAACAMVGLREEAVEHLTRAIRLAEERADRDQQGHAHQALARVLGRTDTRAALRHATRALALFLGMDKPRCQAHGHQAVAWYTGLLGDRAAARHHLHTALLLHRDHPNPTGEANALDSLGHLEHVAGAHGRAVDLYRRALALRHIAGNVHDYASTLDHLGHPLAALGQHAEARQAWKQAYTLYRGQGRTTEATRLRDHLSALTDPC